MTKSWSARNICSSVVSIHCFEFWFVFNYVVLRLILPFFNNFPPPPLNSTSLQSLLPGVKAACPVDHYQDGTGASSCKRCPPGYDCKVAGISDYSGYKLVPELSSFWVIFSGIVQFCILNKCIEHYDVYCSRFLTQSLFFILCFRCKTVWNKLLIWRTAVVCSLTYIQ
jgi:hypothetical protein